VPFSFQEKGEGMRSWIISKGSRHHHLLPTPYSEMGNLGVFKKFYCHENKSGFKVV
jgi:hypothetical protein